MRKFFVVFFILFGFMSLEAKESEVSIYDFNVKTISGEEGTLEPYKDKIMLIVQRVQL